MNAFTSLDGQNWTKRGTFDLTSWRSVCWSPELHLFVAVSDEDGPHVMASYNGAAWYPYTITDGNYSGICWSPKLGIFTAVALEGSSQITTTVSYK
jgi:hypothetical protein